MLGAFVASRHLDAMDHLPSAIGRLTRERYDSCPRGSGKVPSELSLLNVSGPAQQLRGGRILIRTLAPPIV
jgi:hypothetical protein